MGLCARFVWGMGCVGVVGVLEFRFSTCSLAVWGVGLLGFGDGGCVLWGCVSVREEAFLGRISST